MYKYGLYLYQNFIDIQKKQDSFRLIKKASERGFIEATYELGLILVKGDVGIPQDMDQGFRYVKIAAEKGHIDAIGSLGQLYMDGKGVQANTELAIKYFEDAIEKGSALAMNEYANMLCHGKGVPIDYDLATKYFKMAIDKGYARAMNDYGCMIENMEEVPPDYDSSLEYFKMAAEHGDDDIYSNLSLKYFKGDGVSVNHNLGVKYAKMALKKGTPEAIYNYAYMLRFGIGVPVNYEEAIKYAKIAIEKGQSEAMLLYAIMLENGEGVPANKEESNKYYKMAIEHDNVSAMLIYGSKLERETGNVNHCLKYLRMAIEHGSAEAMDKYGEIIQTKKIGPDYLSTAAKYYKMASDKGYTNGMYHYGYCLTDGVGVPVNIEEGLRLTKICIDRGDPDAMNTYGAALLEGKGGIPININKGIKYLRMSAEGGSYFGNRNYGLELLNGGRIPSNAKEAAKYLKIAADMGDASSMHTYAHMLTTGMGVPINMNEAIKYYKKAIDEGFVQSMHNYAFILSCGHGGVPVDANEAVKYYKMAIDRGFPDSMNSYAVMNLKGIGIPVNYEEAIKYFKMAIEHGYGQSMDYYAFMLAKGLGVPVDLIEAEKYYKMAIDHGYIDSMTNLAQMLFTQFMDSIASIAENYHKSKNYLNESIINYIFKLQNPYKAIKYLQLAIEKGYQLAVKKYQQFVSLLLSKKFFFINIPDMYKTYELISSPKKKQDYQIHYFQLGYSCLIKHSKFYLKKSIKYFKKSANLGFYLALFFLGKIYSNGYIIPINKKEAIDYFFECINIIKNQNTLILTVDELELTDFIYSLSSYNIGLLFYVDFRYKDISEHYFKIAVSSNNYLINSFPLCVNGLGIYYQFCFNDIIKAKKLYQNASENNFWLAYYNLGYLLEIEGDFDEAIKFYIKASENENVPLTFHQYQLFEMQYEVSKAFVICLTNLKLVLYYLSISEFKKSKKYFIKSLSKLGRFSFKFNRYIHDEKVIIECISSFSYLRYFYLNSSLFNIKNQKNLTVDFIENLMSDIKFNFVESKISSSNELFDFIVNKELIYQFKNESEFIVQRMESILYTYPYDILFGRISIEQSDNSPTFNAFRKNINNDFYEGFDINNF